MCHPRIGNQTSADDLQVRYGGEPAQPDASQVPPKVRHLSIDERSVRPQASGMHAGQRRLPLEPAAGNNKQHLKMASPPPPILPHAAAAPNHAASDIDNEHPDDLDDPAPARPPGQRPRSQSLGGQIKDKVNAPRQLANAGNPRPRTDSEIGQLAMGNGDRPPPPPPLPSPPPPQVNQAAPAAQNPPGGDWSNVHQQSILNPAKLKQHRNKSLSAGALDRTRAAARAPLRLPGVNAMVNRFKTTPERDQGKSAKDWAGVKYGLQTIAKSMQANQYGGQFGWGAYTQADKAQSSDLIEHNQDFLHFAHAISGISDVAAGFGALEYLGDYVALRKEFREHSDAVQSRDDYKARLQDWRDTKEQVRDLKDQLAALQEAGDDDPDGVAARLHTARQKLATLEAQVRMSAGRYMGTIHRHFPEALTTDAIAEAAHQWKVYGGLLKYSQETVDAVAALAQGVQAAKHGGSFAKTYVDGGLADGLKAGGHQLGADILKYGLGSAVGGVMFGSASALYYGAKAVKDYRGIGSSRAVKSALRDNQSVAGQAVPQSGIMDRVDDQASDALKHAIRRVDRKHSKARGAFGHGISLLGNAARACSSAWSAVKGTAAMLAAGSWGLIAAPVTLGASGGAMVGAAVGSRFGQRGGRIGAAVGALVGGAVGGAVSLGLVLGHVAVAGAGVAAFAAVMASPVGIAIGATAAGAATLAYGYKLARHRYSWAPKERRKNAMQGMDQLARIVGEHVASKRLDNLARYQVPKGSMVHQALEEYNRTAPYRMRGLVSTENPSFQELLQTGLVKRTGDGDIRLNLGMMTRRTTGYNAFNDRTDMRRTFLRMQSEYAKTVKSGNPDESLNLGADADLSSMSLEQVTKLYRFASNDLISRDTQAATDALYDQLISEYQAQQAGVPEATRQRRQAELADLEPDRTPGWFRSPVSQAYRQHMDANQDDSGAYAGGGQVRQVADFLHDLAARRGGTLNVGGKELKPEELMAKVLQSGVDLSTGQRLKPVPSDPNDEQSVAQAKQALKDAQTAAKALLAQALALK